MFSRLPVWRAENEMRDGRISACVPVKCFAHAKTCLASLPCERQRRLLAQAMLHVLDPIESASELARHRRSGRQHMWPSEVFHDSRLLERESHRSRQ